MIDPKKLAAVAGDKGPKGGGPPPQKKGGGKGGGGPSPYDVHEDVSEDDETPEQEGEELDEGMEKYADLVQMLEANAQDVEEHCEGLDQDFLTDASMSPDDDQRAELEECLESLPEDLADALREDAVGISWDDAMKIGNHLEDEGMVADGECVAGFVFHVGQLA